MDSKVRLHITGPLGVGQPVALTRDQAHYLSGVMRLVPGDTLTAFDGASGAWRVRIGAVSKRGGHVEVLEQVAPQRDPPDLWLLFAPIKKARTDFIVEKATELGASRILPVSTRHTNSERIRRDRLQAHAVEAAEQCGGTFVPEVAEIAPLAKLLDDWPDDRALIFCDERLSDDPAWAGEAAGEGDSDGTAAASVSSMQDARNRSSDTNGGVADKPDAADPATASRDTIDSGSGTLPLPPAPALPAAPAAILIGPEGGFSPEERTRLRAHPNATAIALGPRILRADTAAVAALTLWQASRGDWR